MKKYIMLSIVCSVLFSSCKKKEEEENLMPAISGVLFTTCGGSPSAGISIQLWRDAVVTPSVLQSDYPAELMETAITDASGNFKFTKYHSETWNMTIMSGAGMVLTNGSFSTIPDRNVGNLYLNGFTSDVTLIWKRGAEPFDSNDSLMYSLPGLSLSGTAYYSSPDTMKVTLSGVNFHKKMLYSTDIESYQKFQEYVAYQLFNGNSSNISKTKFISISECQSSASLILDSLFY